MGKSRYLKLPTINFSTTGTLQSFQSSEDINSGGQRERLEKTFSWDTEEGINNNGDASEHADNVCLAQAIQGTPKT